VLVERKVSVGCVMLVGRRKFAYRYVAIGIGCSEDYCGLFTVEYIINEACDQLILVMSFFDDMASLVECWHLYISWNMHPQQKNAQTKV